jgi:hypothetical protein
MVGAFVRAFRVVRRAAPRGPSSVRSEACSIPQRPNDYRRIGGDARSTKLEGLACPL